MLHKWFKRRTAKKNANTNNAKKIATIATGLAALVVFAVAVFWLYVQLQTYPAETELLEAIRAEDGLTITEGRNHFILTPQSVDPTKPPIIYYPGGLVAPEAYLYKMGRAAVCLQKPIYIIKAPFNAAIFDVSAAGRIINTYDLPRAWVGGHSLGGISACRYAAGNPEKVFGLFLFGSYCDRDLSGFDGQTISVMGLQDQIITLWK